jgi:hypothetical protein
VNQLFFPIENATSKNRPAWAEKEKLGKRVKREEARKAGICIQCLSSPSLIQRFCCRECLMSRIIGESFKFDRKRKMKGLTELRGTCYVDQFGQANRKKWIEAVKAKWTGFCYYSGLPIEIGSTAGLDHMLPVSRAAVFGPSKVFHPDNLVWTDRRINMLKSDMTADEFHFWLRNDLPAALSLVDQRINESK